MKLCKCDMCETVVEAPAQMNGYGGPPVPKGWASVTIVREVVQQPRAMPKSTMSIDAGEMGAIDVTTEAAEVEQEGYRVAVATALDLCSPCLERLVTHPKVSKRVAEDDARAEVAPGYAPMITMPALSVTARRRPEE